MKIPEPAPIILFTYNRLKHTRETIEALQKNQLAKDSLLYVFSDGPKDSCAKAKVQEVRAYLRTIDGFNAVSIIEQEKNLGLAESISGGVSQVIEEHGRAIVVEDDIVTEPGFLLFMNAALEKYRDEERVWHISGWNYPISPKGQGDTFFWRLMNCWGWATWADRWSHFERNPEKFISRFTKEDIHYLNLDGAHDSWWEMFLDYKGKTSSWAIYWYAVIALHRGLCLNPVRSFVKNIGDDGSGTNCDDNTVEQSDLIEGRSSMVFDSELCEDAAAVAKVKEWYQRQEVPVHKKVLRKLWQEYVRMKLQ